MKKLFFIALLVTTFLQFSCATGPNTGTSGTATANVATGAVDVGVDQSFTVTFTAPVKTNTVTTSSFYVVPVEEESESSLVKFTHFDIDLYNRDNAIEGVVSCESSTQCSLIPAADLEPGTEYAICLTSDIQFEDIDTYGYFEGMVQLFTTEAAEGGGEEEVVGGGEEEEEEEEEEAGGDDEVITYSVGGTVTGLNGTVVLQNNASDDLSVSANGSFIFDTELEDDANYAVTVKTQPAGQNCTVTSGNGTINSANITTVSLACVNLDFSCGEYGAINTPYANSGEAGIDGSTEEKAYTICTAAQLDQIGQYCTNDNDTDCDKYFKLMADLDLTDYEDTFHMIGYIEKNEEDNMVTTNEVPFTGTFDGNDHTLSNLNMTVEQDAVGFIRFALGATVKDLTIENFEMAGHYSVSNLIAIAGVYGDLVFDPTSDPETDLVTVTNVTIDDTSKVYFYDAGGYYFIGAVAGAFAGDITNAHAQADINSPDDIPGSFGIFCGGLVGSVFSETSITNASSTNATMGLCILTGGLIGNAGFNIDEEVFTVQNVTMSKVYSDNDVPGLYGQGGLVGMLYGEEEDDILLSDCFATGDVSATELMVEPYFTGGLIGGAQFIKVDRCYASGNITSDDGWLGGLIGTVVPADEPITVLNSFSTGDVEGDCDDEVIGPVIGLNDGTSTFTNTGCFDDVTVTNHGEGGFNTDYCDLENQHSMAYYYDKTSALYVDGGWDFDDVWEEHGDALPTLR